MTLEAQILKRKLFISGSDGVLSKKNLIEFSVYHFVD